MGAPNHCGASEKHQKCHTYFLQYGKFAFERAQVWTWERQTCFLPRAPSNFVTPLYQWIVNTLHWQELKLNRFGKATYFRIPVTVNQIRQNAFGVQEYCLFLYNYLWVVSVKKTYLTLLYKFQFHAFSFTKANQSPSKLLVIWIINTKRINSVFTGDYTD